MQLEATTRPIKFRLCSGVEVVLRPGVPTELPDSSAKDLLLKAPGKVREVITPSAVLSEPDSGPKSVYWESMDGKIMGPGHVLSVTQVGSELWMCVEYDNYLYWIRDEFLRSRQAFEAQTRWSCGCCQHTAYWTSIYGNIICRNCHPKPAMSLVERRDTMHHEP